MSFRPTGSLRIAIPLFAALLLGACAQSARIQDDRLMQAGFTKVPANTPDWMALMNSLPPHRFAHRTVNGARVVYYADPIACKCVYMGSEEAMAKFSTISLVDMTKFSEEVSTTDYLKN